jgi:hypothetical protein
MKTVTSKKRAKNEYPAIQALLKLQSSSQEPSITNSQAQKAKTALEYIIFLSDAQMAKNNLGTDFKTTIKSILDWHNPKFTQATGPLVKALGQFFIESDTYALGADILGYLAIWSPLLSPERLVELLEHAKGTQNPYQPSSSIVGMSGQLSLLCQDYTPQIRLALAKSLWDSTHKGRWWTTFAETAVTLDENELLPQMEHNRGLVALMEDGEYPPANRGFEQTNRTLLQQINKSENFFKDFISHTQTPHKVLPKTRRERAQENINLLLEKAEDTSIIDLIEYLKGDTLVYDDRIIPYLQKASREGFKPEELWKVSTKSFEVEEASLLVWIKEIPTRYRPLTPLPLLISAALEINGGVRSLRHEDLPKKPQTWSNFFDNSFLDQNNFKLEVPSSLTPQALRVKYPELDFHIISNTAELYHNAVYMGNCTGRLLDQLITGSSILYQIKDRGLLHNVQFTQNKSAETWYCAESKARFNAQTVSLSVASATEYIAAELSRPLYSMKL